MIKVQSRILKLKVGIAHDKKCIWILILKQSCNLVIDDDSGIDILVHFLHFFFLFWVDFPL